MKIEENLLDFYKDKESRSNCEKASKSSKSLEK